MGKEFPRRALQEVKRLKRSKACRSTCCGIVKKVRVTVIMLNAPVNPPSIRSLSDRAIYNNLL